MIWKLDYLPETKADFDDLDGSQKKLIRKAIHKISQNPLSKEECGYGKPLGNKRNYNLSGFLSKHIMENMYINTQ